MGLHTFGFYLSLVVKGDHSVVILAAVLAMFLQNYYQRGNKASAEEKRTLLPNERLLNEQ